MSPASGPGFAALLVLMLAMVAVTAWLGSDVLAAALRAITAKIG